MIGSMLSDIICREFEKVVGKRQLEQPEGERKALHVGFGLRVLNDDEYHVAHMYIYGPMNYVFVAVQTERIDAKGCRIVEPMELLCYHDSCWRDAVQRFIFKNREEMSVFRSFGMLEWCDVICVTEEEGSYLRSLDRARANSHDDRLQNLPENPWDRRGCWGVRS